MLGQQCGFLFVVVALAVVRVRNYLTSAQMNQMRLERIYEGHTPDDLIRPAWVGALLVLVPGLILARMHSVHLESARSLLPRFRREGKRKRWPSWHRSRYNLGIDRHERLAMGIYFRQQLVVAALRRKVFVLRYWTPVPRPLE